jgi:citrate lyase beta subunit
VFGSETTFLFVPADRPRRLTRAWESDADAVIADLEDAVAPEAKMTARDALHVQLVAGSPRGLLCVRINALDTDDAVADLELVSRWAHIDAIVVPKATAAQLRGRVFQTPVIALIETATGLQGAAEIAATPGVERLMLGSIDLAADLGIEIGADSPILATARATLAIASAAAGIAAPIDGVWTDLNDDAGLRTETRAARCAGFTAKACIHPDQLEPVKTELDPSAQEVARAREIVSASERAELENEGAITVAGQMVDRPVAERARRLLARAERSNRD